MCNDTRIYDPEGYFWWHAHALEWWARAENGLDAWGCPVSARIVCGGILAQHGENPEAVRWFSLDALNRLGRRWNDQHPLDTWHQEIHAASDAQAASGRVADIFHNMSGTQRDRRRHDGE